MKSEDLQAHFEKNKTQDQVIDADHGVDRAVDFLIKEAVKFEESQHINRLRLVKLGFGISGVLAATTISLAVAIAIMMPLKQTEPIMIKSYEDGYAEVIRDFSNPLSFDKEVDEYFIKEHVTTRESYDWHKVQYTVDYVQSWSADNVYKEYYDYMTSEQGLLNILKDNGRIEAKVTAINLNKDAEIATLRLVKTPKEPDGKPMIGVEPTHWVAELKYELNSKQNHKERAYNPFGYKITSYTLAQDKTK